MFDHQSVINILTDNGFSIKQVLDQSKDNPTARLIADTALELDILEGDIESGARDVAQKASSIRGAIDTGNSLNSLGEFQSMTTILDTKIARRESLIRSLTRMVKTMGKAPETEARPVFEEQEVTIVTKSDGGVIVHKTGCHDIKREMGVLGYAGPSEKYSSREEVVVDYNSDFDEEDWTDLEFASCVTIK